MNEGWGDREFGRLFADNLQAEINVRGWSRRRLARESGVRPATTTAIFAEGRCPRIDIARAFARALDTTIDELCDPYGAAYQMGRARMEEVG